jgi:uridine kinase
MILKYKLGWAVSRAAVVILFVPVVQVALFAPFLSADDFNLLDPWSSWLRSGGRSDAFPYGPVMLLLESPVALIINFCRLFFEMTNIMHFSSMLLTSLLLVFDYFATSRIINLLRSHKFAINIFLYSPLIFYSTYVLGQNDLLPAIVLLMFSEQVLGNRWRRAGLILGLGVCIKFSLLLVIPFVLVYFFGIRNKNGLIKFTQVFLPISLCSIMPTIWSFGYTEMVIMSPEFVRSLDFAISIGNLKLYLLPIGYVGLLLVFWSIGRMTPLHLITFASLSMLLISIMQIRSVGWYVWGLLSLTLLVLRLRFRLLLLFLIWQITIVVAFGYKSELINLRWGLTLVWVPNPTLLSLFFTLSFTIGILFVYKLVTETTKLLDPFSLGKRPMSIAISGDSGVGKDTLSIALHELINNDSISYILGDDYHIAERANLIWKSKTHLDASVNDLSRFNRDVNLAANKKAVVARHYNHETGKFTPERVIPPGDFLIVNGLHAIMIPEVQKFDLKVFLKMDDSLRISLKVARDIQQRGHASEVQIKSSIEKRRSDATRFVDTQMELADIIIETCLHTKDDLGSIYYKIRAKEDVLMFEMQRKLQAVIPEISWIDTDSDGMQSLFLEPGIYSDLHHHALVNFLIPDLKVLIPNPHFKISPGSLLSALVLFAAARRREFLYAS